MGSWQDEGFEERTSDIVGTWNHEGGPVRFIPTHATVGDGKKFDKSKPSLLIFGKLTAAAPLQRKSDDEDDETEAFEGKAGDLIGVWAKPGMRDIANLCGTEVILMRDEAKDKDIGKGNDMKGYRVLSKETPNRLIPITSDRRDASKGTRCFLDPADYGKKTVEAKGPAPF